MVDHHVDRPEVEAGQPAQLTGTNRSIGLSAASSGKDHPAEPQVSAAADRRKRQLRRKPGAADALLSDRHPHNSLRPGHGSGRPTPAAPPAACLAGLVAIARGKTPDPIPNSAVKTLSADGTASQGAEE